MAEIRASYGCTALASINKAGILKPNSDGYYPLVLGALDVYNSAGQFYPSAPAKEVLETSEHFRRRISSGNLKGENGHPHMLPGMTMDEYINRIMTIEEKNVCCHISTVRLVEGVKDINGRPTLATIGDVKPAGAYMVALQEALDNPKQNVCFSIRSLTQDVIINGRYEKRIRQIVTWDWVTEPGIRIANKFSAPTLESLSEVIFTESLFRRVLDRREAFGVGLESGSTVTAEEIEDAMGWARGKIAARKPSIRW